MSLVFSLSLSSAAAAKSESKSHIFLAIIAGAAAGPGACPNVPTPIQLDHPKTQAEQGGQPHVADYRLSVNKWVRHAGGSGGGGKNDRRRFRAQQRGGIGDALQQAAGPRWAVQVSLWSLNPAVAFAELAAKARSVVLTSGTLAPLESFATEASLVSCV